MMLADATEAGLWPSAMLSLRVAVLATALAAVVTVPLAFVLARRRFIGRGAVETLLTLPLVLPPTVIGYLLLRAVGARSTIGTALREMLGASMVFHWSGAVLAACVVAVPMLYLPSKAAFAAVERELEDVSRLMGANLAQVFWHVSLPLARRGVASGVMLAFARAIGEFGATVMLFGTGPGTRTLPISIYTHHELGEPGQSAAAVLALTLVSILVIAIYNRSSLDRRD